MPETQNLPHTITIRGATFQSLNYSFTVSGAVEPADDAVDEVGVIEESRVVGGVKGGDVDTYHFSGDITAFTASGWVDASVEYGEEAAPEPPEDDGRYEFQGEGFQIRSTAHTPAMTYRFHVDTVEGGESLEDADSYTETETGYQVEGTVGPKGSDTYYLRGKISEWETERQDTGEPVPSTRFETAVAGEREELWKLLGNTAPEYDDTSAEAIGGGEHYSQKIREEDADVVVSSHEELYNELPRADPGDIVFVDPDTECYSPSKDERYYVPDGVTLASNRGVDGSKGALLHTDVPYSYGAEGLVSVEGDDARVTGLRIRGPHPDPDGGWVDHSYDYEQGGVNARRNGARGLEVDNCEIWGFAHLVVSGTDGHVHHNDLHHANMKGLGYCTSVGSTEGTIFEFNHCRHWRHVVAGGGKGGYEARFNLIDGPAIAHVFDQHSPGGSYTRLHHNTCRVGGDVVTGDPYVPFATFRGSNPTRARIWNNWAFNPLEPREEPAGWTDEFITHAKTSGGWGDIEWWNNHLGESEPPSLDIGCPR